MARLAATAVLLLSLLAVASCRVLEAEPETAVAISDEQIQAYSAVPEVTDAAEAIPSLPTVTVAESVLRLPSHRCPCRHGSLHRHLRWALNHGLSHRRGAFAGPGDARVIPAILPEEPRETVQAELEAVAEPDPDSQPDMIEVEEMQEKDIKNPPRGDGDGGEENESVKAWKGEMLRRFHAHGSGLRFHHRHHHHELPVEAVAEPDPDSRAAIEVEEVEEKDIKKPPRGDGDGGEENESVKAWKGEMLRRFHAHGHGLRFHHHHHEHAVEKDDSEHQQQQDKEEGAGDMQVHHVKLFGRHFHHHNHGDDEEQEETARKHYLHHHQHDSDNEVDEVEDLARRLSKAIMRRSFSRGGIRHHLHQDHHHQHVEEGGVRKWFKGLLNMNRF